MAKKILHYILLLAILLGVPYVCCVLSGDDSMLEGVKAFPPRTEDWGAHPEKLWNFRRPFSWWAFAGLAAFTFFSMRPFVVRALKAAVGGRGKAPAAQTCGRPFPWWGWMGCVILAAGWILSWNRFEWFRPLQVQFSYFPLWMGFILIMNALVFKRSGRSPMTDHPVAYAATFPASSLFWWFFEYLNRYVWNWYYLGIADLSALEYSVYATICFASVLPAVTAVAAWLATFSVFDDSVYDGMARVDMRKPGWNLLLLAISALGLSGVVFFPDYAYPLLWISPLAVFVMVQAWLREPCAFDSFARGNWSIFFRFSVAALVCGLCWETWNWHAYAKWVYAVPWVHRFQIWEMPILGFAGYLPFGAECAVVTAWICPALVAGRRAEA